MPEFIKVERKGRVGLITLDRPRQLNALSPQLMQELGKALLDLDADAGRGQQPLLFVDQASHDMRMGWYNDSYVRTEQGWRLKTRSMTFLRRSGARDSGRAHDPLRPEPTAERAG